MLRRFHGRNEFLFVIVVVTITILAMAVTTRIVDSDPRNRTPTSSLSAITDASASPIASASSTQVDTTSTVAALPTEALIQTAEQAVARAFDITIGLGAEHPHVAAVDVRPLQDAFAGVNNALRDAGQAVIDDLSGWPVTALQSPVWVVQLDGDTFGSLTCMANTTCGGASTIVILLDPIDGAVINMSWGVPVPTK